MNCTECQEQLEHPAEEAVAHLRDCEACRREREMIAREQELYSAYAASTELPELWPGIEARIATQRPAPRSWRMPLAIAATVALLIAGTFAVIESARPPVTPAVPIAATLDPVSTAAAHYEAAIARLEPAIRSRASSDPVAAGALALLPQLSGSIGVAQQEVSRAANDPAAAATLMAAYDAKLQLLRSVTHER